jgi:hypothetical protein
MTSRPRSPRSTTATLSRRVCASIEAEADAATSSSVVLSQSLASIWFYRGVLEYYDGDRDQKTLELWRLALARRS